MLTASYWNELGRSHYSEVVVVDWTEKSDHPLGQRVFPHSSPHLPTLRRRIKSMVKKCTQTDRQTNTHWQKQAKMAKNKLSYPHTSKENNVIYDVHVIILFFPTTNILIIINRNWVLSHKLGVASQLPSKSKQAHGESHNLQAMFETAFISFTRGPYRK